MLDKFSHAGLEQSGRNGNFDNCLPPKNHPVYPYDDKHLICFAVTNFADMIYYRLLRNNKESGPFSEEDLIASGFKPYDLLWAEGKSAGWQYPSEISVFKKYAPIVEEQPYDRFYKKQQEKQVQADPFARPVQMPAAVIKSKEPAQPQPVKPMEAPAYNYNIADLPVRHVHVTLPSGNTVNLTTLVSKKDTAAETGNKAAAAINTNRQEIPKTEKTNSAAYSFTEAVLPASIPETYSMASREPVYAASSNQQRTEKTADTAVYPPTTASSSFSWTLLVGSVIGIATLLGLGIMIGLSINRDKNDLAFNEALKSRSIKQVAAEHPHPPVTTTPATPDPVVINQPIVQHAVAVAKEKKLVQNTVSKAPVSSDERPVREEKLPVETPVVVVARNLPVSNKETAGRTDKPLTVNSTAAIERNLTVRANDFKAGAFGGISNLKCTIYNGSKQPLASVEVAIDYIQANNKVYKTEKLLFKEIAAGGQATIDAPESSRGIRVASRIIKINPKDAGLADTTVKS